MLTPNCKIFKGRAGQAKAPAGLTQPVGTSFLLHPVVFKLKHQQAPKGLVETQLARPYPRVSHSRSLAQGLRN